MKELTSANVDAVAKEVLDGDTNSPNFKKVPMIAHTFGFDMTKLEEHRRDVRDMLGQLPKTFFPETGGGWSFLQACVREWSSVDRLPSQDGNPVCYGRRS